MSKRLSTLPLCVTSLPLSDHHLPKDSCSKIPRRRSLAVGHANMAAALLTALLSSRSVGAADW